MILAAAERNGKARIQQVLDDAGIGISVHTFPDMRKNVEDKAALGRMTEEASRRRYNRLLKVAADRHRDLHEAARPRLGPEKPMAAVLIAGPLTEAEQLALYPKRYAELARFGTVAERINTCSRAGTPRVVGRGNFDVLRGPIWQNRYPDFCFGCA